MTAPQSYPDISASLGELFAQFLVPAPPPVSDEDAMIYTATSLSMSLSYALTADFEEVWRIMTHLPEGYLRLLESPEGWAALSAIVAAGLGISTVPIDPAIH